MTATITKSDRGAFLISGELGFSTVSRLVDQGNELFKNGGDSVALDLMGVTRCDSAGLALLIEWRRSAEQRNQILSFSNIPRQLQEIAQVGGVTKLLS